MLSDSFLVGDPCGMGTCTLMRESSAGVEADVEEELFSTSPRESVPPLLSCSSCCFVLLVSFVLPSLFESSQLLAAVVA